MSNVKAWLANEANGKGRTETNLAGAARHRKMAEAIERRLQELESHTYQLAGES